MARTDPQVNFRIPSELNERLKEAAAQNGRTITAELVQRLEGSFRRTMDDDEVFRIVGQLAENVRSQKKDAETARGIVIQADALLDLVLQDAVPLPKEEIEKFQQGFKKLADIYRKGAAGSKNNVLRVAAGLPELPEPIQPDAAGKVKKKR